MKPIRIELSSVIRIPKADIPEALAVQLGQRLIFRNPLYGRSTRFGRKLDPEKVPETLVAIWEESENRGIEGLCVVIPKGFLAELVRLCHTLRLYPFVVDLTTRWAPPFESSPLFERAGLTNEQERVVAEMQKHRFGILTGAPGSGKRLCAVKLAIRKQVPMLVVVHTRADLYQWRELVTHKDNGIDPSLVGLLGDGHLELTQPVTIAIGPTLRNYWDTIPKDVGLLVLDRCDYASWSVVWKTKQFNCTAQWGLATGARVDGLTRMMEAHIGPRLVALESVQAVPALRVTPTEFDLEGEYEDIVKVLAQDPARNSLIAADILQAAACDKRCIVLSDRIAHLSAVAGLTAEALGPEFAILHANVKEADTTSAITRFNLGKLRILAVPLKSVPLLDPVKQVDRLFIIAPVKATDYLMRLIVRMRDDGIIHEYKDRSTVLRWSLGRRVRVYRKMGIR